MITFLSKMFIKDRENYSDQTVRGAYGTLCGVMGIVLNAVLFALKLLAGTLSGSIAITADAFNNLSDAGSSVITLAGFRLAGRKPDPDHPFGHGRMEYITGLIVSFLIVLMGFELAKSSIEKIISPEPTMFSWVAIIILAASVAVKLYMAFYNRTIGKKINSAAMKATATDSLSDCISTTVVLIATVASRFTTLNIDAYCGALVSLLILWAGIKAAKETIDPLLGQPPEKEFVDEIESIVLAHPEIHGVHDLIVHNYGPGRVIISLHAEVSADGNIMLLHDAIDNVEFELADKLGCMATIHMDPVELNDENILVIKELVKEAVRELDEMISMHDFRMVAGVTHTNVIFDVVVPFKYALSDSEVKHKIAENIKNKRSDLCAVIQVDHSYVG